ncbi:MAG: oligosaccharide flippase family protein, partial [Cyclobacteriaceae bacterium]|nr:oligosaccharide flippase family protein [Cyclobacteriaceae bacterium]
GILIGFTYFPLSLEYLGVVKFGIFLTLISMVDWFLDLDVGIGHGLRNKFGESIAQGNDKKALSYVSTAYFTLGAIIVVVTIIFLFANLFIPWAKWLNASPDLSTEIKILVGIIIIAFAIRFISGNIYELFYALQKMAYVELFRLITKASFLILIIVLILVSKDSLLLFGGANSLTFALVPLIVGIYFFRTKIKQYSPSFKFVRLEYFKALFSLGIKFFLIRVSMIIIHQTNNFLIAGFVSLDGVPQYAAAYKYLSIFLMLFVILTNQLWSSNVEAYNQGDINWMKKSMWMVLKIWIGTVLIATVMVVASPIVYKYWLQDNLEIPILISVFVAISICTTTWVNMFNLVLNGTGKIKLQMYAWIFAAGINIPASIYFVKVLNFGVVGIVLGTIVSLIPVAILSPVQVIKILNGKESGIWAK